VSLSGEPGAQATCHPPRSGQRRCRWPVRGVTFLLSCAGGAAALGPSGAPVPGLWPLGLPLSIALTGGCLAGKKPQDASESFIFRIIHPQQYTQSRTESIGVPALYTSTVGGRGRRYGPGTGLLARPVRSRLSGQTHPQTSRSAPAHSQYPGARAPEGLGRTADRTLTPITRAGRAPRPPLSSP